MNRYKPHVIVIPEDHADEQLANGFVDHDQARTDRIKVMPVARGWPNVLKTFQDEYVQYLRTYPTGHVVMLIDFDCQYGDRRPEFDQGIPDDLKPRVFVIGPAQTPETLKEGMNREGFERIGRSLAEDCYTGTETVWGHDQLKHNDPDRRRLVQTVRPFLFDRGPGTEV